jgi:hypothetical protein
VFRCLNLLFVAVLLNATTVVPASAQSTVFTYQGSLDDGGVPASGPHDLRFRLFDAASGGAQLGSTLCVDNVTVVEGVFTAQLDFGQQFATTGQRHLEIEVRRDTGLTCGSAAGFIVMTPRQQLTATPMASHASGAFSLDAADGSPASAVFVDNGGNVGIGTTTPGAKLHVNGTDEGLRIDGPGSGAPNSAYVSFRDANGVRTGYVGDGSFGDASIYLASDAGDVFLYTATAALTAKNNGNVGIGTTTPAAKLDVRGNIKLGTSGQYSALGGQEDLRLLRGDIDGNGTIMRGAGFTVSRFTTGVYDITFSPAFSGIPTITALAQQVVGDERRWPSVNLDLVTASSARIIMFSEGNGFFNSDFSICVIGPR